MLSISVWMCLLLNVKCVFFGGAERQPISLEAILKKKEEELEKKDRPRFMSRKERQKMKESSMDVQTNGASDPEKRHRHTSIVSMTTTSQPAMVQSNVSDLRKEYLGVRKMEKKVIRGADRLKFVFEWTEDEDTSKEVDPLYDLSHRKTPLFSQRGHLGGTKEIRIGKGLIDERGWRKKELTEMTDRDWRIFRDEFQITAKGGNIPNPLRFWEESSIPPVVLDSTFDSFLHPFGTLTVTLIDID
jgi:ATP-dependent RNA helicase DDX23/PRP28